jgi:hypothetical protein
MLLLLFVFVGYHSADNEPGRVNTHTVSEVQSSDPEYRDGENATQGVVRSIMEVIIRCGPDAE